MDYSLPRKDAADILQVSTRTLDRYIKKGKLSHKKIANQVFLNQEEVTELAQKQNIASPSQEVVSSSSFNSDISSKKTKIAGSVSSLDEKIEKFFEIFEEKEKTINNKDKMIFMLQQRIGELETKVKSMVALPDYTKEKQAILLEKQKLEDTIEKLQGNLQSEKTKSFIMIGLILIVVLTVLAIMILR